MKLVVAFEEAELTAIENSAIDLPDICGFINCSAVEGCENCPIATRRLIEAREHYQKLLNTFVAEQRKRNKEMAK